MLKRNALGALGPSALVMALLASATSLGQQPEFPPEQVEAELVERFTRFVDWPVDRLADPNAPFVLGLVGHNGVGPALERLARSRGFKDRKVEIRRLSGPDGVEGCHAVWITATAAAQLGTLLARTSGKPILTLGDTEGFAERGVLINLRREATRIGFEINLGEAKKSGLKFSSRLLELGKIIEAQGAP